MLPVPKENDDNYEKKLFRGWAGAMFIFYPRTQLPLVPDWSDEVRYTN